MKYCPYCRCELKFQQAKFCHECGADLFGSEKTSIPEPISKEDSMQPIQWKESISQSFNASNFPERTMPKFNINELGTKLEAVVEKIYQSRGYSTQRRQKIIGQSGTPNEIDVVAKKGTRVLAIECKNHSSVVGIEPVRDFNAKLTEIGLGGKGVFVAYTGLSRGAEEYAQFHRIEIMSNDELEEKWLSISIGRTESIKGQSLSLEHTLPINVSFSHATTIKLTNKEKVKVSDAELIFHPYFLVQYNFSTNYIDPSKGLHKLSDRGAVFIDALNGKILNEQAEKGLGLLKVMKKITSANSKFESARTKHLISELKDKNPLLHYDLQIEEDYHCNYQKPEISERQAIESAMQFIIEKNTTQISYVPKSHQPDEFMPQVKYVNYAPRKKDIQLFRRDIVIVPRWSIEFESKNSTYRREVLACSGIVLEDTMAYCPNHFKIGSIEFFKKQSVAVCETCGKALCEEHIRPCTLCGKWLCSEHSFDCEVCKNRFCLEHEHIQCSFCIGKICYTCLATCSVCKTQYSPNHSVNCDLCGRLTCPKCIITTGLIRKNRTCINCSKSAKD